MACLEQRLSSPSRTHICVSSMITIAGEKAPEKEGKEKENKARSRTELSPGVVRTWSNINLLCRCICQTSDRPQSDFIPNLWTDVGNPRLTRPRICPWAFKRYFWQYTSPQAGTDLTWKAKQRAMQLLPSWAIVLFHVPASSTTKDNTSWKLCHRGGGDSDCRKVNSLWPHSQKVRLVVGIQDTSLSYSDLNFIIYFNQERF